MKKEKEEEKEEEEEEGGEGGEEGEEEEGDEKKEQSLEIKPGEAGLIAQEMTLEAQGSASLISKMNRNLGWTLQK